MPKFSIIIPVFNAAKTLPSCMNALLGQDSGPLFDVIVTNDGSTDGSLEILNSYVPKFAYRAVELKILNQENQGAAAALQTSARASDAEFLIMHGADDRLAPNHISALNAFIDEHPDFDIYASNARYFSDLDGSDLGLYHAQKAPFDTVFSLSFNELLKASAIYGTAAIRRSYFEQVGGFDTRFYNEDYHLWLKLLRAGARHIYRPDALSYYRVKDGQKTADTLRVRSDDIEILTSFLEDPELEDESKELIKKRLKSLKLNIKARKFLYSLVGAEPVEELIRFLRG